MTSVMIQDVKLGTSTALAGRGFPSPRPPQVRRLTAGDVPAVLAMLERCSRQTLLRRFHGAPDHRRYYRRLCTSTRSHALGVFAGDRCLAVGELVPDRQQVPHLGVLVEDHWQRRGLGSRLLAELTRAARACGSTIMHADVMATDAFVLQILGQAGPLRIEDDLGVLAVDVDLTALGQDAAPCAAVA